MCGFDSDAMPLQGAGEKNAGGIKSGFWRGVGEEYEEATLPAV